LFLFINVQLTEVAGKTVRLCTKGIVQQPYFSVFNGNVPSSSILREYKSQKINHLIFPEKLHFFNLKSGGKLLSTRMQIGLHQSSITIQLPGKGLMKPIWSPNSLPISIPVS
jgi:hypothetical protein